MKCRLGTLLALALALALLSPGPVSAAAAEAAAWPSCDAGCAAAASVRPQQPVLVLTAEPAALSATPPLLAALARRLDELSVATGPVPGKAAAEHGVGVLAAADGSGWRRPLQWQCDGHQAPQLAWAQCHIQQLQRHHTDQVQQQQQQQQPAAQRVVHALNGILDAPLVGCEQADNIVLVYVANLQQRPAPSGRQSQNQRPDSGQSELRQVHAELKGLLPRFSANLSLVLVDLSFAALTAAADEALPAAVKDWATYLGNGSFEDAYSDGSGLNKALTLTRVLAAGGDSGNTLQAHLLAEGVVVRFLPHKRWGNRDVDDMARVALPVPLPVTYVPQPAALDENGTLPLLIEGQPDDLQAAAGLGPLAPQEQFRRWTDRLAASRQVQIIDDAPAENFIAQLVENGEPVVLRNGITRHWPASRTWANMTHFAATLNLTVLSKVKQSRLASGRMFDPDFQTTAMAQSPLLSRDTGFSVHNMTSADFFSLLQTPSEAQEAPPAMVYFNDITAGLHEEVKPDMHMYLQAEDWMYRRQFIWVSTAGCNTHLHFDQDYNVFVQMVGRKRFTLFPPSQTPLLHPFPRAHPLWHKSRLDFDKPDLRRFPDYQLARGVSAEVGPGDLLYVPPYYWHHVETLTTPSVSLSTLSHDDETRDRMDDVYKMDHKFDRLASIRGKVFAMRLYLDLLLHEVQGNHPQETQRFFVRLLTTRYSGLELLFEDDPAICEAERPNGIPTAQHVYGDCITDMKMAAPAFKRLPGEVRDLLLADYIEDIAAPILGVEKIYSFFRYCFRDQEYYLTELGSAEHDLWEYEIFHEEDKPAEQRRASAVQAAESDAD